MTSVVLLHRDAAVAQRLRQTIDAAPPLAVAGIALHVSALAELLTASVPDLLVIDLLLPGLQVQGLLQRLRRFYGMQRPAVLALSVSADDPRLMDALRGGADGYFTEAQPSISLLAAIDRVLHGESTMSPQIARELRAELDEPGAAMLDDTDRQLLQWTAQGYLANEVARGLRLSPQDLGVRIHRLYTALQSKAMGAGRPAMA